MEVHIIGGGIAGLTAAYSLSQANYNIYLWEKEPLLCSMSSARNAAIFRTYEADPTLSMLVKESYLELLKIEKSAGELLDRRGLIINPLELDYYETPFVEKHIGGEGILSSPGIATLPDGSEFKGIMIPENGIIDIHQLQDFFLKQCKNITINYNSEIEEVILKNYQIKEFVVKGKGNYVLPDNSVVINAAGAWAAGLMQKTGVKTPPVNPYKRHLFFIRKNTEGHEKKLPVIWDEKRDVYIRPEGNGLLATHCDQRECSPGDYSSSEKEVHRFLESVTNVFPFLKDYHISRYWACLRTFSLDQHPTVGFDPVVSNLFWVAGLGGRGMTVAPGLIGVIRRLVQKEDIFNPFSPSRFF